MALLSQVPPKMRARVIEMALEIKSVTRRRTRGGFEVQIKGINKNGFPFCLTGEMHSA